MTTQTTVRRATEDDWALVQDARLRALIEEDSPFVASRQREEGFKELHWRLRLRSTPTWLAVSSGGAPRGMVCLIEEPGSPADDRHVTSLWVDPAHRRQGIAWSLLDTVRRAALADGARTLSAWVVDDDVAAGDLAVRAGFARTDERHPLPRDPSRAEERLLLTLA
ncbi:GNAT family N-acetyltransferase [Sanguibacter suaedae]|uniref:GNAT family N-acetyltransferase n=1 Tax=Sanguibacter suaedae TaxID=2795737 RepID=A0A934I237_9MICO|nr:GNAT family N-acetyltransferase [Sanguibacter suaedae]MBI9114154.1 GNAT family N-acetyltransferase [Sanguibacter suaedae]